MAVSETLVSTRGSDKILISLRSLKLSKDQMKATNPLTYTAQFWGFVYLLKAIRESSRIYEHLVRNPYLHRWGMVTKCKISIIIMQTLLTIFKC